ncbi:hypothetical protein CUJ83_08690 [Methanocella sp. CWC-04]|uniref:HdeD family acid-resistance protein n=1 Tax=Methanooceanicella nereidis TaxID=2052831 RepID=A0AAP2RD10_9EURY|nr:HdeD family acid-resistance protein [Methanocella sp. CWC-04]MCD1295073.1 hypothetical protein [Methanocella sp. CWC-04]
MAENVEDIIRFHWGNLWWDTLLRGFVAIVFGLLLLFLPGLSISIFVMLFGAFAFFDGILLVLQSISSRTADPNWWVRILQGIIGILAGIAVFVYPGISALVLLYFIAFYLVFTGILQIVAAIGLRKVIKGELLLIASGILAIIVGAILIARPGAGALALAQTIGIFAIAYGILECILAFRLRSAVSKPEVA